MKIAGSSPAREATSQTITNPIGLIRRWYAISQPYRLFATEFSIANLHSKGSKCSSPYEPHRDIEAICFMRVKHAILLMIFHKGIKNFESRCYRAQKQRIFSG